jgi:hypothetical protein
VPPKAVFSPAFSTTPQPPSSALHAANTCRVGQLVGLNSPHLFRQRCRPPCRTLHPAVADLQPIDRPGHDSPTGMTFGPNVNIGSLPSVLSHFAVFTRREFTLRENHGTTMPGNTYSFSGFESWDGAYFRSVPCFHAPSCRPPSISFTRVRGKKLGNLHSAATSPIYMVPFISIWHLGTPIPYAFSWRLYSGHAT